MKHTLLFATIASFVVVHAYANNIVTSKTYVDNRDALKVDIAQGTGDNNANVGKTLVVNSSGNLELGTPAAGNYVEDAITDGVTDKAPSENAVHDALENKQDVISTAEVDMNGYDLPALVSYDTTNGLTGNRIGIFDYETVMDDEGDLNFYSYEQGGYGAEMDNYVPTVRTVANALTNIWSSIPSVTPITWNSNDATAVNNYSTSFTGTGNWPSAHKDQYVTGSSLAQGLALKQNKIPARATKIESTDSTYAPSVVTNGTTNGSVGQMAIITDDRLSRDMRNYTDPQGWTWTLYEGDTLIPTLGAAVNVAQEVGSHLQGKLGGGSYAGKVVTATGTPGTVTYTATYDGSTTYNASTDASKIAIVSAVQRKKTCAGWLDGTTTPDATHTDANCVLWNLPD